jgi:hypothetical protein
VIVVPPTSTLDGALQALDRSAVVPRAGDLADTARHRRPVGRHIRRARPAGDAPALGQQFGRAHHRLRGDTAPIGALAADEVGLDAHDLQTGVGQVFRDLFPAGAQTDDDGIDLHGSTGRPSW